MCELKTLIPIAKSLQPLSTLTIFWLINSFGYPYSLVKNIVKNLKSKNKYVKKNLKINTKKKSSIDLDIHSSKVFSSECIYDQQN